MLTTSDQELLIEIAKSGGKILKKTQKTFGCKFYNSVSKLVDLGLLKTISENKDKRIKTYHLTDAGKFFAMVLLGNEKHKDYMVFFMSSKIFEVKDKYYTNENSNN